MKALLFVLATCLGLACFALTYQDGAIACLVAGVRCDEAGEPDAAEETLIGYITEDGQMGFVTDAADLPAGARRVDGSRVQVVSSSGDVEEARRKRQLIHREAEAEGPTWGPETPSAPTAKAPPKAEIPKPEQYVRRNPTRRVEPINLDDVEDIDAIVPSQARPVGDSVPVDPRVRR